MDGLPLTGSVGTVCPHFRPAGDEEIQPTSNDSTSNDRDDLEEESDLSLGEDDVESEEAQESNKGPLIAESPMVALPTGESLTLSEIGEITCAHLARVIIIAGENDCGKTTLLACLNEEFQRNPYGGMLFAGSSTLVAFEKICHDARVASNRTRAKTERTLVSDETRFLHLIVRPVNLSEAPRHVLISNTSGEIYKRLQNLGDEAKSLQFLKRADHFVLFLNGEKLSQTATRTEVSMNAGHLMRRLLQEGLLGAHSQVDVLISKWDAILLSTETDSKEFVASVEKTLRERFESDIRHLRFFHIAPRPDRRSGLKPAHGLEDLFESWVREPGIVHFRRSDEEVDSSTLTNGRASSRFKWVLGS